VEKIVESRKLKVERKEETTEATENTETQTYWSIIGYMICSALKSCIILIVSNKKPICEIALR